MNKRCIGCGAILQNEDEKKVGYAKAIENKYCMRCFRLIHYNDLKPSNVNKDNMVLIDIINKTNSFVYFLCDVLTINQDVINTYHKLRNKKVLVLTKVDLLPNDIKIKGFIDNVKRVYKVDDIMYLSSKNNLNTGKIVNNMIEHNLYSCYILGYTNAGKSSLINKIMNNDNITISKMPNTTIDFMNIHYDDLVLTDTPGFTYDKTLLNALDFIKRVLPNKMIKPITYQTKDITGFIIDDKYRLCDFGFNSVTFYMSNDLKISKKFNLKNDDFEEVKIPRNSDIVIREVGFIKVREECVIKISKELLEFIEIRSSLIGANYE